MDTISLLLQTNQTVFTTEELRKLVPVETQRGFESFLYRAKKDGRLLNPRQGIWTLAKYEPMELACKIKKTAYISCETVLFREGVFFQFYGNTFSCVADDSRKYTIDDKEVIYYKIKSEILNNPIGIKEYDNYRIATPERALCDYMYINPRGVIDAPESINKIRLKQILPIYPKQTALYIEKLLHGK
ncbi:MAG TPA: hypothetical protein PKC87_04290 [Candidatus Absconditabacterales bacterium]|nr:hypothetical protein [Candidatus Absconditabacterales bacterium]